MSYRAIGYTEDLSGLRVLDHRHAEHLDALNRHVTRVDHDALGHTAEGIGTTAPVRAEGHGVDERRHPARVPIRFVRQDGGADRQPRFFV